MAKLTETQRRSLNECVAKGEVWSAGMARRLRVAANDNEAGGGRRKVAA